MKLFPLMIYLLTVNPAIAQTLQLHYDMRHTVDPRRTERNFPTLYFDYFTRFDSTGALVTPGSFLLKMQADLLAERSNMGKFYLQVSQTFKFWKPAVYMNFQYSGGLGITQPRSYSYYISNSYSVGLSYPFTWGKAYMTGVVNYKFSPYIKPSHDVLATLYWWKPFCNYKGTLEGDCSVWLENKNHGDEFTKLLRGKRVFFFAEPQCWYRIRNSTSAGVKFNMYYHVLINADVLNCYPSFGIRCKL